MNQLDRLTQRHRSRHERLVSARSDDHHRGGGAVAVRARNSGRPNPATRVAGGQVRPLLDVPEGGVDAGPEQDRPPAHRAGIRCAAVTGGDAHAHGRPTRAEIVSRPPTVSTAATTRSAVTGGAVQSEVAVGSLEELVVQPTAGAGHMRLARSSARKLASQVFHYLANVFSRVFPVLCGQVSASSPLAGVSFSGEHYTIAVREATECHQ